MMKMIIGAYVFVILILIALLSILSYGYGIGYVYIYWREIQIQTNIWVLFIFLAVATLCLQLLGIKFTRYLNKEKRKSETIVEFNNLHPYEQLAVIWLLDAAEDRKEFIQQVFAQSSLLNSVVDSQIYIMQGRYSEALTTLNDTNIMAFELAEIQRIQIYLAQKEYEKALTHLDFLSHHELSPWLKEIESTYKNRLTHLWGEFAIQSPWLYLHTKIFGDLAEDKKQQWLKQILSQFDQAKLEDLEALKQRYSALKEDLQARSYEVRVLWLKVLARLSDMNGEYEYLAIQLLNEKFSSDVFYLWFQLQMLRSDPDYIYVEQKIKQWEEHYSFIPVFSFVKWHLYMATERENEAEELLDLYPDNVLMNYLRVKSKLKNQEDLVQLLNTIFESNSNYLEIKI